MIKNNVLIKFIKFFIFLFNLFYSIKKFQFNFINNNNIIINYHEINVLET